VFDDELIAVVGPGDLLCLWWSDDRCAKTSFCCRDQPLHHTTESCCHNPFVVDAAAEQLLTGDA